MLWIGSEYDGEWSWGQRNGVGTTRYANGDVYTGEWSQDKREGDGVFTEANGRVTKGIWANGKLRALRCEDGASFEG